MKERFHAARQAIGDEVARQEKGRLERERREAAVQNNLAARLALCQKVESLEGETRLQELQEARDDWQALQPLPSSPMGKENEAKELTTRFERAGKLFETQYETFRGEQAFRVQLEELLAEADKLVDSVPLGDARRDWPMFEKRWAKIEASPQADQWEEIATSARQRFVRAGERLTDRQKRDAEHQEQSKEKNLSQLTELVARIEKITQSKELSLRAADRELRSLPLVLKGLSPLPSTESRKAWKERLTKSAPQSLHKISGAARDGGVEALGQRRYSRKIDPQGRRAPPIGRSRGGIQTTKTNSERMETRRRRPPR